MTQITQSAEDRKRMHAELLRDPEYVKSRNTLLWVSVICCVSLAMIGLMIMFDRLSMDMASVSIGVCVMVYFYFMFRVIKMRSTAEMRWAHGEAAKKEKKKDRKKAG